MTNHVGCPNFAETTDWCLVKILESDLVAPMVMTDGLQSVGIRHSLSPTTQSPGTTHTRPPSNGMHSDVIVDQEFVTTGAPWIECLVLSTRGESG